MNKFINNKKLRVISFGITVLIFTSILMLLNTIHTFHSEEEFTDTETLQEIISEQTYKIYEYCIAPNTFNIKYRSYEEIFGDTYFLDPNYQFIIRTSKNSYQSISDSVMEKYSYSCAGTEVYYVYDSFNNADVTIYIESYISTSHHSYGKIFNCYKKFNAIETHFNIIVGIFVVLVLLFVLNIIYLIMSKSEKDNSSFLYKINDIYYEIPFVLMLILIETSDYIDFMQFTFTNYFGIFIKLYLLVFSIVILVNTTFVRFINRTFVKTCFVIQFSLKLGKFIREILANLNHKLRAPIILVLSIVLEGILIECTFYIDELWRIVWLAVKIAQAILLLQYFSNICKLNSAARDMQSGASEVKIDTRHMYGVVRENAEYINNIYEGFNKAIDEKIKSEQLKTELITNVSHDLKTPLTSIINYVDLMKKEKLDNKKAVEYLEILDKHSKRLKTLTENVIEASKAATGNIKVNLGEVNINEIISQALGEYESKFKESNLTAIYTPLDSDSIVQADGNLLWRVIDNLFSNVYKYSMENTRVYIDITESNGYINVVVKNISKYQLNISSEELMQRFVRGDESRSTSGNGLGLSISQSLMSLQKGKLEININGDLFTSHIYINKGSRA